MVGAREVMRWRLAVLGALLAGGAGLADDVKEGSALRVLSPSLGRPVFVGRGCSFELLLAGSVDSVQVGLESRRLGGMALAAGAEVVGRSEGETRVRVTVPGQAPRLTYDVVVKSAGVEAVAPHCVAVGERGARVRLVHISDLNLGDPHVAALDPRLAAEVNLLAPDAVLATGDLVDVRHANAEAGWDALVAYIKQFDAPWIIASGEHESLAMYSARVAASPIGICEIGPHEVVVLYDTVTHPIVRDGAQLAWAAKVLRGRTDGLRVMVSHAREPGAVVYWARTEVGRGILKNGRIAAWVVGGARDGASAEASAALEPAYLVGTHAGGTAVRGGASGVPHYRLIELDSTGVRLPLVAGDGGGVVASQAVGRLGATAARVELAGGGGAAVVTLTARNAWATGFERLAHWVSLPRVGGERPWCEGGRLVELAAVGSEWLCRVEFGVAARGIQRVRLGTGGAPERVVPAVSIMGPGELVFVERGDGTCRLTGEQVYVLLQDVDGGGVVCAPELMLAGEPLAYRSGGGAYVWRQRVVVPAGGAVRLDVDWSAVRVSGGVCALQVYLDGGVVVKWRDFEAQVGR